jgi:hypothetical protein
MDWKLGKTIYIRDSNIVICGEIWNCKTELEYKLKNLSEILSEFAALEAIIICEFNGILPRLPDENYQNH